MASSVKARPNHYEVLGLSPTATQEEIGHAFAKEMGMFGARPVAAAAQIGLAYEVLRDPIKRRVYDDSLGLTPKPEPRKQITAEEEQGGTGFIGWGSSAAVNRVTFDSIPRRIAEAEPRRQAELTPEQRLASIVASLRDLANRDAPDAAPKVRPHPERPPPVDVRPQQERQPQAAALSEARLNLEQLLMTPSPDKEGAHNSAHHPVDWSRPALAIGAFIMVAGLVGALSGISVKNAEDQVTVQLPSAKPPPNVSSPAPPAVVEKTETQAERPFHAVVATTPIKRAVSSKRPPAEETADRSQTVESAAGESSLAVATNDPLAPAAATVQPIAASMPLPNGVIARTIERIGYECGEVNSTVAVEGAPPGTFKVTCSSGHTYQAKPVRGRYRFKRLAGQ